MIDVRMVIVFGRVASVRESEEDFHCLVSFHILRRRNTVRLNAVSMKMGGAHGGDLREPLRLRGER